MTPTRAGSGTGASKTSSQAAGSSSKRLRIVASSGLGTAISSGAWWDRSAGGLPLRLIIGIGITSTPTPLRDGPRPEKWTSPVGVLTTVRRRAGRRSFRHALGRLEGSGRMPLPRPIPRTDQHPNSLEGAAGPPGAAAPLAGRGGPGGSPDGGRSPTGGLPSPPPGPAVRRADRTGRGPHVDRSGPAAGRRTGDGGGPAGPGSPIGSGRSGG